MAVTKITYENKEAIQNDASVANKSKVTDDDMNEIKKVVNNNADEVTTMQETIEDLQEGQGSANADITSLKNRVNTLESNVSNLENNKVDKIEGKSLSTEDFTTELKTKLEGLNNYDDTDIKEEQIQQNKNIENLQTNDSKQDELISKLKSAALNAETEEAKSLHIKDANKFGSLEVLGNHEQETRSGKNLYNLNDVKDKAESVVVDEDNWIEISLDETKQDITYMNYMLKPSNKLKTNATYYLILEIKELSGSGNLNVSQYLDSSKSQIETSISRAFSDLSVGTRKYTVTTIEDFTDVSYMIRTFASFNVGQTGKIVFRLSLLEQDVDTSNFEYEKYGASPSPEYPSPVVCLEGSTKISKINKNRFNKNTAIKGFRLDALGEYYVQSNYFTSDYISAKPLTYYAVNYTVTTAMQRICFYDKNKKFISTNISSNVFQTPQDCKYIRICNELTYLDTAQLEENKNSTDFVEHEQTDYILNIQQEMLEGDYFVKEADGWKEVHAYGKSIITENADIVLSSATVDYIEFRINNALNSNSPNNYLNTYSNLFSNKANNRCTSYNNYLLCRVPADLKITTVEEFKEILQENNLVVYYKLASQVELECTEEQIAVLEELNNLDLYKPVTNIITTEDIALLKLKYALDVETYVDNKIDEKLANINQQILNIAGGN